MPALAVVAMLAVPPVSAEPRVQVQTRCFQSVEQPARFMALRFVDTDDDNEAAFVRDVGMRDWTPLALSSSKSTPMADSGRSQLDEAWLEVVHGEVRGRYLVSMLGNEMVSLQYVDRRSGAKTDFRVAPPPRGDDACRPR